MRVKELHPWQQAHTALLTPIIRHDPNSQGISLRKVRNHETGNYRPERIQPTRHNLDLIMREIMTFF
jgi:hypothetical protein